jgi:hypothetical protein
MEEADWYSKICVGVCSENGRWNTLQTQVATESLKGTNADFREVAEIGAQLEDVAQKVIRKAEVLFLEVAFNLSCYVCQGYVLRQTCCDKFWHLETPRLWKGLETLHDYMRKGKYHYHIRHGMNVTFSPKQNKEMANLGLTHAANVMKVEAAVAELDVLRALRGTEEVMKKLSSNGIREKIAQAKLTEEVRQSVRNTIGAEKETEDNEKDLAHARQKVKELKRQLERLESTKKQLDFWNEEVERLDSKAAKKDNVQAVVGRGKLPRVRGEMNLVSLNDQGDESSDVASSAATSAASSAGTIGADGGGTLQGKMGEEMDDTTEERERFPAASAIGVTRRHKRE